MTELKCLFVITLNPSPPKLFLKVYVREIHNIMVSTPQEGGLWYDTEESE